MLTILLVTFYCISREKSHSNTVQTALARYDIPLPDLHPGEWLHEHTETGKS